MVKIKQNEITIHENQTENWVRAASVQNSNEFLAHFLLSKTLLYRWLCHGTSASILCLTAFDSILCYLWN